MFLTPQVRALFKTGKLKLMERDDRVARVAEATFVIEPFEPALARELGEDIAGHLYTDSDDIRDELEAIDLTVRVGVQRVTVHAHAELPAVASLAPVLVRDVSVKRVENEKLGVWLAYSFVLAFDLTEKAARNFVLDHFGSTLLLTFARMDAPLPLGQDEPRDDEARVTMTNERGDVMFDGTGAEFTAAARRARRAM